MYDSDKQIVDTINEHGIITTIDLLHALNERGIRVSESRLQKRCTSLKKYGILRSFKAPGNASNGHRCINAYWGVIDE